MGLVTDFANAVGTIVVGAAQKAKLGTAATFHAITAIILFNTMLARRTATDLVCL
jgi:hypothetical protein